MRQPLIALMIGLTLGGLVSACVPTPPPLPATPTAVAVAVASTPQPTDMPSATTAPTSTFTPVPTSSPTPTDTPAPTVTPEQISFGFDSPKPGDRIPANTGITCEGTYSLPAGIAFTDVHIWIVLKDDFGNYYLQSPQVELKAEGRWEATNIRPGPGITQIVAIQVTNEGHKIFLQKAEREDWIDFKELPEGSRPLANVNITTK